MSRTAVHHDQEIIAQDVDAGFQYPGRRYEAETARAGMWLFLATEMLFFGGIVWAWIVCRIHHPAAFGLAAGRTNLPIAAANTALLLTASYVFTRGVQSARRGDNPAILRACRTTALLALAFLALKSLEWGLDIHDGLVPGPAFAIQGPLRDGAQLFFALYFVATGLHGVHMLIGLGLLAWVAIRARRGDYSAAHHTQVEVVGLYWSFVDLVWLTLFPLIYLVARP